MQGPIDVPGERAWEPEPLELPVDDPRRRIRENADESDDTSDLPGRCVIVIDLT